MKNKLDAVRGLPVERLIEKGELHLLSAKEMHDLIAVNRLRAEQLTEYALNRISHDDSGAFVELDSSALEQARKIDLLVKKGGDLSPLSGVLSTTKDTYANSEVRRQFSGTRNPGSTPRRQWKSKKDAWMVDWLRVQGAVITATTETSNLALDTQVHNVRHPYGEDLASRGSSAGAAVAARLLGGIHLTSDASGSGRGPMVYNTATYGLMLPYCTKFTMGHRPPLFEDPDHIINFGRAGFASQYVQDLSLAANQLGLIPQELKPLNKRLLLIDDFGDLSLNNETAMALERGVKILIDSGFRIDKRNPLEGFDSNELIRLVGRTIGCRIAESIKNGPWKNPVAKTIWRRTLASLILNQMDGYYSKEEKRFAQGNPGEFLQGVQEGLRDSEKYLEITDKGRIGVTQLFENVSNEGYDGILMPLDHAGQFKKCSTLQPIQGKPYFDATAGLAGVVNLASHTSALAMPTGIFSGLPYGMQVVSSGPDAVSNVLQIGQITQGSLGKIE